MKRNIYFYNINNLKRITMKKLFTLAFALISFNSLLAQTSGGPDAFGYVWRDNNDTLTPGAPVYNWIDIVGLPNATQVKSLGDDNTSPSNPIGFPFHYYWYDRTSFIIGSNGYIIFNGLGALAAPFLQIPLASLPQDFISVFASDITFTDQFSVAVPNADCWFYTTPNNDSLIVSWISVPFYDQFSPGHFQGENTFQMILTSVDSSITFQYMTQIGVYQNTVDFLTIGIENVSGTVGLQHSHDIYPVVTKAIKFYYPASTSLVITDAATSWNTNPSTGAVFLSQNGSDFVLTTEVENAGNTTINPFNVTSQVINSGGSVIVTNTTQADTLIPGQSQLIVQPNVFSPTITGTYRFSSTTQLANDLVASNNLKIQEVRVLDTTAASIPFKYEDGTTSSGTPLSWGGGSGGAGYYFVPPFYPCYIDTVKAFIASNAQAVNFFMEVYDDDGPFNNPGTRLDSQLVSNPQPVATGDWFSVAMPTPIQIDSGGFYVSWNMDGDDIQLGIDINPPFSNRTYEVLGNSWAVFRYRETQDLMIRAICSPASGSGIGDPVPSANFGNFYPNPSDNEVSVKFTMGDGARDITYSVYDMQGKEVYESRVAVNGAGGIVSIPISEMKAGVYNCKFIIDGKMLNRRFVVAK